MPTSAQPEPVPANPKRRWWQFSLGAIFLFTLLAATLMLTLVAPAARLRAQGTIGPSEELAMKIGLAGGVSFVLGPYTWVIVFAAWLFYASGDFDGAQAFGRAAIMCMLLTLLCGTVMVACSIQDGTVAPRLVRGLGHLDTAGVGGVLAGVCAVVIVIPVLVLTSPRDRPRPPPLPPGH